MPGKTMTLSWVCADAAPSCRQPRSPLRRSRRAVWCCDHGCSSRIRLVMGASLTPGRRGSIGRFTAARRLTEGRLHVAAVAHGEIVGIGRPRPPSAGARLAATSRVSLTPCASPSGKQAIRERALRPALPAPHAEAALAVEHLAGAEPPLGDRDHVGAPRGRARRSARSRNAADATEMPSSSPIMWIGR